MGTPPEPERAIASRRGSRRDSGPLPRRAAVHRRTFTATEKALEGLVAVGATVSVHVDDLDRDAVVLAGDDFVTLPLAGLGVVPLLVEVAARIEAGTLDSHATVDRATLDPVESAGLWQHLATAALPVSDLAVLAAASGDQAAANALLTLVGLPAVRDRIERLGMPHSALLDRFRDRRGPDDAPQVALGTTKEVATLFAALVNAQAVSAAVSAQVAEWLSLNQDLSLVASATGLDPFAHTDDRRGLLFINKTGRASGVRAEAGVLAGPRAGVAYALVVRFEDASIVQRLQAHDAFRTLGVDLMEYVF